MKKGKRPARQGKSDPGTQKKRKEGPLEALLREKEQIEKKSKGYGSLSRAENSIKRATTENDFDFNNGGGLGNEQYADEAAAARAVREATWDDLDGNSLFGSPQGSAQLEEVEIGRLFGKKKAKAIGDILGKDQTGHPDHIQKALGVPFWIDESSEQNLEVIDFDVEANCAIIRQLKDVVALGDMSLANLLLSSGVFKTLGPSDYQNLVPWLFRQATPLVDTPLTEQSFRLLLHLLSENIVVPFSSIKLALIRFGARISAFNDVGWTVEIEVPKIFDPGRRAVLLFRLVALIATAARSKNVCPDEAADVLLALHLIAVDPATSPELCRELGVAIDILCNSLDSVDVVIASIESAMCTKLLEFSSHFGPVNKSLFVSFLGRGSGRARRIGRWLAQGLLTGKQAITEESCSFPTKEYGNLPPLVPIITLLSPVTDTNSGTATRIFDFHENSSTTDYEDLKCHIQILGVALSSIDAYTAEEPLKLLPTSSLGRTRSETSLRESEKPSTDLQMIGDLLHLMYEKTIDRGGIYLDRSRTKEAIQHLEFRIEYQRNAALQRIRPKQKKDIRSFFQAKR